MTSRVDLDTVDKTSDDKRHPANSNPYSNESVSMGSDLVGKKAVGLMKATETLGLKRKDFDERMYTSSIRRNQLKKDVDYLQERKLKCQSIIRENDGKRWRALQKFCTDNHLCTVRKKEKHMLNAELRKAKQTYASMSAKAADLRKYEEYMLNVVGSLPKDYIKLADDVIAGLMMRYTTLYETNTNLRGEMEAKAEEVRIAQTELKQLVEAHRILIFGKNSELSELYTHRQKMNDLYQGTQQSLSHSHDELAQLLSNFKTVIRAINNLSGKLIRSYEPDISNVQLQQKIQNMSLITQCRLVEERTLAIRSIVSQLATDTGTLPISTCSRPELDNIHNTGAPGASTSEFLSLSKLTSAPSELPN